MKKLTLGASGLQVPVVAVGCMRITGLDAAAAARFIGTALELGLNFFDHADIYGDGECERFFAEAAQMSPSLRGKFFIQSKCGIRKGVCYDFSKEHILRSVDGILSRLRTDYLDVLLLHRPDALMEPDEVAAAFDALAASGKVRAFGVSNQTPGTMELLRRSLRQPIVANQLQLSITNASLIERSLNMNMTDGPAVDRDGGTLDYCRLNGITVQPWSPLRHVVDHRVLAEPVVETEGLSVKLAEMSEKYSADPTAIAIAWLLRHPAGMMPVVGTTNEGRLRSAAKAAEIVLSREDWYALYLAAAHRLP
ncbi:MAG: aldo/keto reductase [Clostridiales bacterium]|nr:aldo/keto reductase [Clostridiales bacterium]